MDHLTAVDFEILKVEQEIEGIRQDLVNHCSHLSKSLSREKESIANDSLYTPNTLGIVQMTGTRIDALCAILGEKQRRLSVLKKMKGSEVK